MVSQSGESQWSELRGTQRTSWCLDLMFDFSLSLVDFRMNSFDLTIIF